MGGCARVRQIEGSHRQLSTAAAEPLTVAAIVCSERPGGTAFGRTAPSTSPLGALVVVPPIAHSDSRA